MGRRTTSMSAPVRSPLRPLIAFLALAALATALSASCGDNSPTRPHDPVAVDTARIDAAIVASGLDADALTPLGEVALSGPGPGPIGTTAIVSPVAFRRWIPRADYSYRYTFSDSDGTGQPLRVVALRCKYQKGQLQLVKQYAPQDPTPADSLDRLVDKGMNADWMRSVELRRVDSSGPWIVTGVSEVVLIVDDHRVCTDCHAKLQEVRLQAGALDMVLTGNDLQLDSLLHVTAGTPATVTARAANDAHVVLVTDASGTRVLPRVAPNL